MSNILVIGASRGIGLETVKCALADGHRVRAFARSADQIQLDDPNLERFTGDAMKEADVRGALADMDAVIQTLGVKAGPEMVIRGTKLFSKATRVLVQAMQAEGVSRLVALTGFGTGDSRNQGGCLYDLGFNAVLGRVYDDKNVQEHLIRSSDLAWTIARPVILTDRPATLRYRVVLDPDDWSPGTIARADVADFLVKQVASDEYLHKAPVLIG
ncbi:MAG: NAD(P)H-binding protein [Xanthomonadales bacterium]|nr:NAD(P)H-binding protein [Gammaproteobacteria bacterium]MBT8056199.1 NAD(P)H-binding protein [Gammaproteobacteria bacterium]NNJ78593.1 NAD(P)H-binding protein [Xanthomonadales bacterium]NNL04269.1 NAD(P)H-binding protein [Xanthomonadales bacterium]